MPGGQRRVHPDPAGGRGALGGSGHLRHRVRRAEHRLLPHRQEAGGPAHRGPHPVPGVLPGGQSPQAGGWPEHDYQPRVCRRSGDQPPAAGALRLQRGDLRPGAGGAHRLPHSGERRAGGAEPL